MQGTAMTYFHEEIIHQLKKTHKHFKTMLSHRDFADIRSKQTICTEKLERV